MPRTLTDVIIDEVRSEQAKHARVSLASPRDKNEFGYGYASGYFCAMEDVVTIIKNALESEKNRE